MQSYIKHGPEIFLFSLIFLFCTSIAVSAESEPIRFGVLSIAPPSRIHLRWQPFVDYISSELGQPIEIVVPRGFEKMKKAAAGGEVDFFYINSHVFYRLKHDGKADGVLQMQNIEGKMTSRSEIFVRSDAGINKLEQLKGKSLAFVSPMGAGGYLAPRAYLYDRHISTKEDLKEMFTRNLSTSMHKVLLGDVAAGAMCGVNFRLMKEKMNTGELKTIAVSDDYPENVIAARKNLNPDLVEKFQQVVIDMPASVKGKQVLEKMHNMKIQKFVAYDAGIEIITERLLRQGEFK